MFYNREDLWTVASEVGDERAAAQQAAQTMEPNFVLMKLPGEAAIEFIEILPFTPANRNNLIGWIAGRSDEPNYGNGDRLQLSRRPGWSTARCRSKRASIRTRSCRASCRCGTSRDRRCGAAA